MYLLHGEMILAFLTVLFDARLGFILVPKPFNVKICECYCHCYKTAGCSSFLYVRSDKACYIDNLPCTSATSPRARWTYNMSKTDDVKHMVVRQTCQNSCPVFRGISEQYSCLGRSQKIHEGLSFLLQNETKRTESDGNMDVNHCSILHHACVKGLLCRIQFVLSQKLVDINCRGKNGRTPLMAAARHGHLETFSFLMTIGVDWKLVDINNNNILHVACRSGNEELVKHIISNGLADIESRGYRGSTPVLIAAKYGHQVLVYVLRRAGCSFTASDNANMNILHLTCLRGYVDIVRYILSQGTHDIDSRCLQGRTPVMMAAKYGKYKVVRLLCGKGCNMRVLDELGNNILHFACWGGNVDTVRYVLTRNISDIDIAGYVGRTPVMTAARHGKTDAVRLLARKGCNMKAEDQEGNNILHLACWGGNADMVGYILNHGLSYIDSKGMKKRTPVMIAAQQGATDVVKLLINKGCNTRAFDEHRNNILHLACMGGHADTVKLLLAKNIVDWKEKNNAGRTPVQMAKIKKYKTIVSLFPHW